MRKSVLTYSLLLSLTLTAPVLFSGCSEDLSDKPTVCPGPAELFNNFATLRTYTLNVKYDVPEGYSVFFEVYDQNPRVIENGQLVKRTDLKPLGKGFTDENGVYSCPITIPDCTQEIYIYSSNIGIPHLLKAQISGNDITATSANNVTRSAKARDYILPIDNGFKTYINYSSDGMPATYSKMNIDGKILSAVNRAFNEGRPVNEAYSRITDINVTEDAEVKLAFLDEDTANKNVLGYFCYKTGHKPTSAAEIQDKIIAFPCATVNVMKCGTAIDLHYWENGVDKGKVFPAGTSIGWVLCSDGFDFQGKKGVSNGRVVFYSIPELNPETGNKNHVALFKVGDFVAFGFEDWYTNAGDQDCNDVVFHVTSTPVEAIDTNIPEVPEEQGPDDVAYTEEQSGTLAFEDLWPYQGDYDMNDVVIKYNSVISYNRYNEVLKCTDNFTLLWTGAELHNGFGYQMNASRSNANVEIVSDYKSGQGVDESQSKLTIMLFDDALDATHVNRVTRSFTVNTTFKNRIKKADFGTAPHNPFIMIKEKKGTEIHLTNYAPTTNADMSKFGTGNDKSVPSAGVYYLSDTNYPFAILIPGDYAFRIADEGIRIDKIYPKFNNWSLSKREQDKDWYKYPIN